MSLADQIQRIVYQLKTDGAAKVAKDFEKIQKAADGVVEAEKEVEREADKMAKSISDAMNKTADNTKRLSDVISKQLVSDIAGAVKSFGLFRGAFDALGVSGDKLNNVMDAVSIGAKFFGGPGGVIAGVTVAAGYAAVAIGDWQHEMNEARFVQEQFARAQHLTKEAVNQGTEAVRLAHIEMAQLSIKTALGADAMKAFTKAFLDADAAARASSFLRLFRSGDDIDTFGRTAAGGFGPVDEIDQFAAIAAKGSLPDDDGIRASNRITARQKEIALAKDELAALERQWKRYDHGALSVGLYRQEREKLNAVINGTVAGGRGGAKRERDFSEFASVTGTDDVVGKPIGWSMGAKADTRQFNAFGALQDEGDLLNGSRERYEQWLKDMASAEERYGAFVDSQSKSKLEALFGPVEEIDLYTQSLTALGGVFSAFSEAVGAGYAAIVTGQGSVVSAIKNAASAALMAQGKQSVVAALRETALGFGALAFGSPTAAMHFKSAALHGAVAVAAGAAANALGGGGAGASTPASTGGSSAGSSGGSGSLADKIVGGGQGGGKDQRPIYVLVGSEFSEDSPRNRSIKAREAVDKALRERDD